MITSKELEAALAAEALLPTFTKPSHSKWTRDEIRAADQLWYSRGISKIRGRYVDHYEARWREGSFGCWDVFVHFEDGTETTYMAQITGRDAINLAKDYNKKVGQDRVKRGLPRDSGSLRASLRGIL